MEDQYWLCGLDSIGSAVFHGMFIGVQGEVTHLSRSADLANISYTSLCRDVRLFDDAFGLGRGEVIKDVLRSHGMEGRRIGIEMDSHGMLPDLHVEIAGAVDGWCTLADASDLIRSLRLVKSPQEIAYMRRAGETLTAARGPRSSRLCPAPSRGTFSESSCGWCSREEEKPAVTFRWGRAGSRSSSAPSPIEASWARTTR